MPPKVKISKQDIIDTALALLREGGENAVNARSIAAALGCSTQPIFSNFSSMEELEESVTLAAYECYLGALAREAKSGKYPAYKSFGMAYIRFAKEEPNLFRLMFMTDPHSLPMMPPEDPTHQQVSSLASRASGLPGETAEAIYREMWVFVHGIATLIVTGVMDFQEEEISTMLTDVFQGLKWKMNQQQEDTNHE
jgi:AcrR family transcriptional regulator